MYESIIMKLIIIYDSYMIATIKKEILFSFTNL